MNKMAETEASNWTEGESSREYFEDDTEDERLEISSEVTGQTYQDSVEYEVEDDFSRLEMVRSIALSIFSTVLFAVFVLFAVVTSEDNVGVSWVLFFSLNAAMPFIFLIYWACCFPIFVIHVLAMVNGAWSIVYLLMAAMQGQDTGTTMKDMSVPDTSTSGVLMGQNSIIAMASIGFFSSMYHSLMAEHFLDSKKTESKMRRTKKVSAAMEARKKIERKRRRTQDMR